MVHGLDASAKATRQAAKLISVHDELSLSMPNGDFSIVNARNRGGAIEMLDEWGTLSRLSSRL